MYVDWDQGSVNNSKLRAHHFSVKPGPSNELLRNLTGVVLQKTFLVF